jgi:hypothetical protein
VCLGIILFVKKVPPVAVLAGAGIIGAVFLR